MNWIAWIILGLISGFVASKLVNKTGGGLVTDLLLGIVGAIVGGYLMNLLGHTGVNSHGLDFYSFFVAIIGSIVVLLAYNAIARRT